VIGLAVVAGAILVGEAVSWMLLRRPPTGLDARADEVQTTRRQP
jgi:hypothetical protein